MAEQQLSVRSKRAREIAHRLARREKRSIAEVVERALEACEFRDTGREAAEVFNARLSTEAGADDDLEADIRETRKPHEGIKL